uniref:Pentraxin family member n=1 Tax=Leptobrachium leishanense TaxID=445787 RepID=A0A8C5QJ34_9ANUR
MCHHQDGRMKKYLLWFVVFAGSLAHGALTKRVFLFPDRYGATFVSLSLNNNSQPFSDFTLCLEWYTPTVREYSLLSMSSSNPRSGNAFSLSISSRDKLIVSIGREDHAFRIGAHNMDWVEACVALDSENGLIQVWINNKAFPRHITSQTMSSNETYTLSLGHIKYRGVYWPYYYFEGEMSNVNMWNYVLPPEIMRWNPMQRHGNLINWHNLDYELYGNATIQPRLQCKEYPRPYYVC